MKFLMTGGGTGGHVIPALAVARELRQRGHEPFFVGTAAGLEAKLVPAAGFPIEFIEIGGLNRVGLGRKVKTLAQLPVSTTRLAAAFGRWRPAAVFSMGGYAAGPAMLAAWMRRIPMALMEPNAVPGFTNLRMGRAVARALVNFEETLRYFPPGRAEVTGVPVRPEFFTLEEKPRENTLTVLVTGGSRGSRTLNNAARESWPLFREADFPVRFVHQSGIDAYPELARDFAASGVEGEVAPFIDVMPAAFAAADLVVCRAGAGAVAEVAAAGKPSILVPFPFAADDHQTRNAEVLARAGAARMVADRDFTGRRLFEETAELASRPEALREMGRAARRFARPGAAARAADILEELGSGRRNFN
jgi:UDP-N-acetylglucosamine--N-acetylmuramyl-(pentapeptide) pyrophosphoryl-undecaprenol N-acetylglucosamine transferase